MQSPFLVKEVIRPQCLVSELWAPRPLQLLVGSVQFWISQRPGLGGHCHCASILTTSVLTPARQVHIEFTEGEDRITLEGPTEDVSVAQEQIEAMVKDLVGAPPRTTGAAGVRGSDPSASRRPPVGGRRGGGLPADRLRDRLARGGRGVERGDLYFEEGPSKVPEGQLHNSSSSRRARSQQPLASGLQLWPVPQPPARLMALTPVRGPLCSSRRLTGWTMWRSTSTTSSTGTSSGRAELTVSGARGVRCEGIEASEHPCLLLGPWSVWRWTQGT